MMGLDRLLNSEENAASGSKAGEREIAPGVVLKRRALLTASLALAGGFGLARALRGRGRTGSLSRFIRRAHPAGEWLLEQEHPAEEPYLDFVAGLAREIDPRECAAAADRQLRNSFSFDAGARWERVAREEPLVVYELAFEPWSCIPHHDHRNCNGVLLVLDGEIRCRSFDSMESPREEGAFDIQLTGDASLTVGDVSKLTRRRDNIHELRASGRGARLLDICTRFDSQGTSHYLQVDPRPVDASGHRFRATWSA